jgi:hypothetical protein
MPGPSPTIHPAATLAAMRIDPRKEPESEADGACRICGRLEDLTFEHVPPKSVGNRDRIEMLGIDAWLTREADRTERGQIIQRGSGAWSLCAECNNRAGSLYVPELRKWTGSANTVLAGLDPGPAELDAKPEPAYAYMKLKGLFPGRFTKQMVTMLLALTPGEFGPEHPELTGYALDPQATGLPERYQLYLALLAGPTARFNGGTGVWRENQGTLYALELGYPPYAYILSIDEEFSALATGNITSFVGAGIDEECEIEMQLHVGFSHTPLPLDLRSKAALERDRKANEVADS